MTPGKGGGEDRGAVGGPAGRRALNRAVLLRALRRSGPTTRQELARHSGLSLTTVASLAAELEAAGLVVQRPVVHGGSGRRPFLVAFNRAAGTALSLDIGSRHVAAAVGNRTRPVIVEHRIDLPSPHHDPRAVEHLAVTCAERVLAEAQAGPEVLLGAAVAVARTVRRDLRPPRGGSGTGRAPDLARSVGQRWQIPVAVESRARMGVLAEFSRGDARGAHTLLNLALDSRIEMGIAIGGILHRGRTGSAGGIGHLVVRTGGRLCRCGQRGCLDAYVDDAALRRALLARAPSPEAAQDAVHLLAQATAAAALLVDPTAVVLGGNLPALGGGLVERLRSALGAILPPGTVPPVMCSTLGSRAPLLGGLELVLSKAGSPPSDSPLWIRQ